MPHDASHTKCTFSQVSAFFLLPFAIQLYLVLYSIQTIHTHCIVFGFYGDLFFVLLCYVDQAKHIFYK